MFQPRYRLRSFGRSLPLNLATLQVLLGALVDLDRLILRTTPGIPPIYRSGVRYVRDAPGQEDWCDILEIVAQGYADCKSFAAWRVAELRENGIAARCDITQPRLLPGGVLLYHIRVLFPDGHIEDPSIALGMGVHNAVSRPPSFAPGRRSLRAFAAQQAQLHGFFRPAAWYA